MAAGLLATYGGGRMGPAGMRAGISGRQERGGGELVNQVGDLARDLQWRQVALPSMTVIRAGDDGQAVSFRHCGRIDLAVLSGQDQDGDLDGADDGGDVLG